MKSLKVVALSTLVLLSSALPSSAKTYVLEGRQPTKGEKYCRLMQNTIGLGNISIYSYCMNPRFGRGAAIDKKHGIKINQQVNPQPKPKPKPKQKVKVKKTANKKPFIQIKWFR